MQELIPTTSEHQSPESFSEHAINNALYLNTPKQRKKWWIIIPTPLLMGGLALALNIFMQKHNECNGASGICIPLFSGLLFIFVASILFLLTIRLLHYARVRIFSAIISSLIVYTTFIFTFRFYFLANDKWGLWQIDKDQIILLLILALSLSMTLYCLTLLIKNESLLMVIFAIWLFGIFGANSLAHHLQEQRQIAKIPAEWQKISSKIITERDAVIERGVEHINSTSVYLPAKRNPDSFEYTTPPAKGLPAMHYANTLNDLLLYEPTGRSIVSIHWVKKTEELLEQNCVTYIEAAIGNKLSHKSYSCKVATYRSIKGLTYINNFGSHYSLISTPDSIMVFPSSRFDDISSISFVKVDAQDIANRFKTQVIADYEEKLDRERDFLKLLYPKYRGDLTIP